MKHAPFLWALLAILLGHGILSQWRYARASVGLEEARAQIEILSPLADSLTYLDEMHTSEVEALDSVYADSIATLVQSASYSEQVVVAADLDYDSIESEIRAKVTEEVANMMDGLTELHDKALLASGMALADERRAREAETARATIWMALAEERGRGWDNEIAFRIQESLRADAAEVMAHPPLSLKILKGAPLVALGGLAVLLAIS